jgi:protein SCO1/2
VHAEPRAATVLPAPTALPEFELTDHTGTAQTQEMFKDGWHLLFFGFTHCPDICPTTLAALSSAQKALSEAGSENVPGIVLVSVDPERDSPEQLADYISHFGAESVALTGEEIAVRNLTEPLFIYFRKVPLGEDDYTVDHSSVVLLVNPDGEFHALFSGPIRVDDLLHDLPLIIERS